MKSPVRENCTPGSAGGRPGNRAIYIDCGYSYRMPLSLSEGTVHTWQKVVVLLKSTVAVTDLSNDSLSSDDDIVQIDLNRCDVNEEPFGDAQLEVAGRPGWGGAIENNLSIPIPCRTTVWRQVKLKIHPASKYLRVMHIL